MPSNNGFFYETFLELNKYKLTVITRFIYFLIQFGSVAQSCPILSSIMDCSPPGSSVHGIFQARVLKWGAIAFSDFDVYYMPKPC